MAVDAEHSSSVTALVPVAMEESGVVELGGRELPNYLMFEQKLVDLL